MHEGKDMSIAVFGIYVQVKTHLHYVSADFDKPRQLADTSTRIAAERPYAVWRHNNHERIRKAKGNSPRQYLRHNDSLCSWFGITRKDVLTKR